jgi:hypothetical protein
MNRRDAAQVLALCAWAKKQIARIEDRAKVVADVTYPDEKTAGVVDGVVVSYTSRVERKPDLVIKDAAKFTDWVQERWPTEIEPTVRDSFIKFVLQPNAVEHDGVIVDDQGEVCQFAELAEPVVYTTTRLQKNADDVLQPYLTTPLADLPMLIEGDE